KDGSWRSASSVICPHWTAPSPIVSAPPISRVSTRSWQLWNRKRISGLAPKALDRAARVRDRRGKTRRLKTVKFLSDKFSRFSLPLTAAEQNCERQDSDQDKGDESGVKNSILEASTPCRLCVWDTGEGDHRVKRQIDARQRGLEQVIEFLFRAKCARSGFIAHLNTIADRQIGECVGIFFSP